MSDIHDFLNSYQETLDNEIQTADWPAEIRAIYHFESCLKHEAEKEVYLVRDTRTGGLAILRATSHDSGDRAEAEWAILSQLNHPGIPKTYGRFISNNRNCVVREYIPGQPIDSVVAKNPLSPKDVLSFARKFCDILDYQHSQTPPVIHRDIKPQNIILRPDGSIALTDFGIARIFKPGADSDTRYVGTLPYAPPEQYGYAQSTPQTDIYAFGILLVYLATGSPHRQDLKDKIKDKRLLALIERCIAFDPKDRFFSAREIRRFIDKSQSRKTLFVAGVSSGFACVLVLFGLFFFLDPIHLFGSPSGQVTESGQIAGSNQATEGTGGDQPASGQMPSNSGGSQNVTTSSQSSEGPLYDPTRAGNLTGNIGNGGFAVEGGKEVYLALDDAIYVLNPDGSLGSVAVSIRGARALNYYEEMLYFTADIRGLMCADPRTGTISTLCKVSIGKIYIDNGVLYFENAQDGLNLYTIGFDGSDMRKVGNDARGYYRIVMDGYQFFSNINDGETLYRIDLATGTEERLNEIRSAWISACGTKLYFSDFGIPGSLMCMDLDGENLEKLMPGACSYVNATPIGVFFTNSTGQQLEVMDLDGRSQTWLTRGKCGSFCVTRDWVIYTNKDDENSYWLVRPDGSENHPLLS